MQLLFAPVFHLEVLNSGEFMSGPPTGQKFRFKHSVQVSLVTHLQRIHPRRRCWVLNSWHDESNMILARVSLFLRIVAVCYCIFKGLLEDCTLGIRGVRLGAFRLQRLSCQCGQCVYMSRRPGSRVSPRKRRRLQIDTNLLPWPESQNTWHGGRFGPPSQTISCPRLSPPTAGCLR